MSATRKPGFRDRGARASCAALLLLAGPACAQVTLGAPGADVAVAAPTSYQLVDPASRTTWLGPWRLEATAPLAPRHELRFSAWAIGRSGLDALPGVSLATLATDASLRLDPARATYRYTFLAYDDWAWKLGVSTNLRDFGDALRPGLGFSDRLRFGALPLLHVGGEGRLAARWRLAFDAEGLMTPRGRTLDLGLRVNYSLTPNFLLFGGYRLTDSAGDAEEFYGAGLSNAANFGVRYRF